MPGLTGANPGNGVVPAGRKTIVQFDVGETVLTRPAWSINRRKHEIGRDPKGSLGLTTDMLLLPSGAWMVRPYQLGSQFETTLGQSGNLRAADFQLAPLVWREKPHQRAPNDLIGISAGAGTLNPNVVATGDYFLERSVPVGVSCASELIADAAAYSKPVLNSSNVIMVRSAVSLPFPACQGWSLRLLAPAQQLNAPDYLLSWYFGGPTECLTNGGAQPPNPPGGWCVSLRADGMAELYETYDAGWNHVGDFRYADPNAVSGRSHQIVVIPQGSEQLNLFVPSSAEAPAAGGRMGPGLANGPPNTHANLIVVNSQNTPYQRLKVTGAGPTRIDVRADLLDICWQVSALRFPTTATLTDLPFKIGVPRVPANQPLVNRGFYSYPLDPIASVGLQLYDATTKAPLTSTGSGTFLANDGQSAYYAKLTFSGDGTSSQFLYGYETRMDGTGSTLSPTVVSGGNLRSYSITGPDLDPTHETAHFEISDVKDELSLLRTRGGGIRTRISTQYDPADASKRSVLFEGELLRANCHKRGRPRKGGFTQTGATQQYPSAEWRDISGELVGLWARLKRQRSFARTQFFLVDDAAAPGANGQKPPWKITSIIRAVFNLFGVTDAYLDIPDSTQRLWPGRDGTSDLMLTPAQDPFEYIQTLAHDYLGAYLVYDGNAGGKWRLFNAPQAPYTNLISFIDQSSIPANRVAMSPGIYTEFTPPKVTIEDGTWDTYNRPPEANFVLVTATGDLSLSNNRGAYKYTCWLSNPKSFDWNPAHPTADPTDPDYLPVFTPLIVYDSTLISSTIVADNNAAIAYRTRRLYDQVAHAQKWCTFRCPMPLITDAADTLQLHPRPPRIYDPCLIRGSQALIRNVTLEGERSDKMQMMRVEAMFVT